MKKIKKRERRGGLKSARSRTRPARPRRPEMMPREVLQSIVQPFSSSSIAHYLRISSPLFTKNDAKRPCFSPPLFAHHPPLPPNGTRRFVITIISKTIKTKVRWRKTSGRDRFWRAHRGDGAYFAVVFVRREEEEKFERFFQCVSQTRVRVRGFG